MNITLTEFQRSFRKARAAADRIVDAGPLKAAIDRGDADHAWAPRMDFADACAVVLARNYEPAFVLTADFRDFSAYRVPFASPEGAFHI
jgi:hypothetical protein